MAATKIFATVALIAMFGTAQAQRVLEQPEEGYELMLDQLTLPSSASGGVTMKRCDTCAYSTHVLTNATEFYVNNQPVAFADFKRVADDLRGSRDAIEHTFLCLFVDVDTGRATRLTLAQLRW
jgi:hypothetical protein